MLDTKGVRMRDFAPQLSKKIPGALRALCWGWGELWRPSPDLTPSALRRFPPPALRSFVYVPDWKNQKLANLREGIDGYPANDIEKRGVLRGHWKTPCMRNAKNRSCS